jgi:hypothetical protein
VSGSGRLDRCKCICQFVRLYFATETYQKYLSKKKLNEALDEAEKLLPIDALGVVMIVHGEEYPDESVFGAFCKSIIACCALLDVFLQRQFTRQIWSGSLQSRNPSRGVRSDAKKYHYDLVTVRRRDQRVRCCTKETRKQKVKPNSLILWCPDFTNVRQA